MVDALSVRPGMRVGDFGCGVGEQAMLLASRLQGEGAVYAFELGQEQVEGLAREKSKKNLDNLFSLCVDLNGRLPIKDNLLQCALLSNTLHAIQERETFLKELHRVLSRRGSVLFVDWASSFKNMGPRSENVITPGEAVRLFESYGFRAGNMLPAGSHHYAFIATKL